MKKIYSLFLVVSVIISIGFSKNFLSERFFELQVGVPVNFSNNAIDLNDVFKKELTLDFTKLANEMPSEGLNIIVKNMDMIFQKLLHLEILQMTLKWLTSAVSVFACATGLMM